jgi:K+-sensing histidine kinase KdpD
MRKETGEPRRLEDKIRSHALAFDAILSLLERLGPRPARAEAADAVLSILSNRFGAPRASLHVVAGPLGDLAPLQSSGVGDNGALPALPRNCGFVRWLAETDGPVHVDAYFPPAGASAEGDETIVRALAAAGLSRAIPLRIEETLIGVLFHAAPVRRKNALPFDDDLARRFGRAAAIAVRSALRGESAAGGNGAGRSRERERTELAHAISADLGAALSVARATVSSLEPSAIDEQLLAGLAKGALADLAGAVDRWTAVCDLDDEEGSVALVEARGLVDDVLRGMLAELEERELRVSIEDGTGLREISLDQKRFSIALRGILDAVVARARRGGGISIAIRVSRGGPGGEAERGTRERAGEHLVVEVTGEREGAAPPRIAFDEGEASDDTPGPARRSDRRALGLAVAGRIIADQRGALREAEDARHGQGFAAWFPIDS